MSKKKYCIDCKKELSKKGCSRCHSCENKRRHSLGILNLPKGEEHYKFKNGLHTLEQHYCVDCKCEITRGHLRCKSCSRKRELHVNWIKDRDLLEYPDKFNEELKESIRKRDNYECQNCGITEEEHLIVHGKVLAIHHIDYNKKNCEEDNLISTCVQCNFRANYNRSYWQKHFQGVI